MLEDLEHPPVKYADKSFGIRKHSK